MPILQLPTMTPVSVITGFLGSGKTTILSYLLRSKAMSDTAVIINEFGEIGLDHYLVEAAKDDIVLLSSGCLCCTVRGDIVNTLRGLYERRERGEIPPFRRVLIETTGLADPAPILHTLMDDPLVRLSYCLDGVITVVDAFHASGQLDQHIECVKQVAVADRLILTKTDLAEEEDVHSLRARLRQINPVAQLLIANHGIVDPLLLMEIGLYDPTSKSADVARWLQAESIDSAPENHAIHEADHTHDVNRHDHRIQAHCLVFEEPLQWRFFSPNLASLVSRHAEKLLRVKGVLNVAGEPLPIVVHGVQHQFQRLRLTSWPDGNRDSKLVVITRDLSGALLREWLKPNALATDHEETPTVM